MPGVINAMMISPHNVQNLLNWWLILLNLMVQIF